MKSRVLILVLLMSLCFISAANAQNHLPYIVLHYPIDGIHFLDQQPPMSFQAMDGDGDPVQCWLYLASSCTQPTSCPMSGYPVYVGIATGAGSMQYKSPVPLQPGTYYWQVRGNDGKGDGWSVIQTFTIDPPVNHKPVITLQSPSDGSHTTSQPTLTFSVSDQDNDPVNCQVYIANTCAPPTSCPLAGYPMYVGYVNGSGTLNFTPPSPLAPGLYAWEIEAYDGREYEYSTVWYFTVDAPNHAPTLTVYTPADGYHSTDTTVNFGYDVGDQDCNLSSVQLYVAPLGQSPFTSPISGFPKDMPGSGCGLSAASNVNIPVGNYSWAIRATDAGGLKTESPTRSLYVAQNHLSTITLQLPPDGSHTTTGQPQFTFSVSDVDGDVINCWIYLSDNCTPPTNCPLAGYPMLVGSVNGSGTLTFTPPTPLSPGLYAWEIKANDGKGDAYSTVWYLIVDVPNHAPTLTIYAPADAYHSASSVVNFSYEVSDQDCNLTSVQLYVAPPGQNPFTNPINGFPKDMPGSGCGASEAQNVDIPVGSYSWAMRATDAGGLKVESASRNLYVNQSCRQVGAITICADAFTDLGNNNYKAQGHIGIGEQSGQYRFLYLGDNAEVSYNTITLAVTSVLPDNVYLAVQGVNYDVDEIISLAINASAGEVNFEGKVHYARNATFKSSFSGSCTLKLNSHRLEGVIKYDDNIFGSSQIGLHFGSWDLDGCPVIGLQYKVDLLEIPLQISTFALLSGQIDIEVFMNTGIFRIGLDAGAFRMMGTNGAVEVKFPGGTVDIDFEHKTVNVVDDIDITLSISVGSANESDASNKKMLSGKIDVIPGLTIEGEEKYQDLNCNGRYDSGEPFEDEDRDDVWDAGTSIALLDDSGNPAFKLYGHASLDLELSKWVHFTCLDAVVRIDYPASSKIDLEISSGLKLGNIFDVYLNSNHLYFDFQNLKYYSDVTLMHTLLVLNIRGDLLIGLRPLIFACNLKDDFEVMGVKFATANVTLNYDDRGFFLYAYMDAFHVLSGQVEAIFKEGSISGYLRGDYTIDGLGTIQANGSFNLAANECLSGTGMLKTCVFTECKSVPITYRICSALDIRVNTVGPLFSLGSPANLHVYDAQGRHTGFNKQGGIDTEIPGSEFYYFEDTHQQLVFLPEYDLAGGYTVEVEGLTDSVFELGVFYPNIADGQVYNIGYFGKPTQTGAIHKMNLDISNNWTLLNDLDGDGTFESQTNPDSTASAPLDTTLVTITNVSAEAGGDSAIITWHTNVPATSKAYYRYEQDSIYQSVADTTLTTMHSVVIDSLTAPEVYYVVFSIDAHGNMASFLEKTFKLYLVGDVNGDQKIGITDVVYLVNYLFKNGQAPNPIKAGDANCDGRVTVSDAIYLINYLFRGGPYPGC